MNNERTIDLIIDLISGIKQSNNNESYSILPKKCMYLLNQTIRQLKIPDNHFYVSTKAKKLWEELSSESINKHEYRDVIKCDVLENEKKLSIYKNAYSDPTGEITLAKNSVFVYNDIFHDDHIVPIKVIIDNLLKLEILDYNTVQNELNKIYICRMLKEEDRIITKKYNRSDNYLVNIKEYYESKGIFCRVVI